MRHKYARVTWSVNDVLEEAGIRNIPMTAAEAEKLLRKIEKRLKGAMISIGWSVIAREMRKNKHNKRDDLIEHETQNVEGGGLTC